MKPKASIFCMIIVSVAISGTVYSQQTDAGTEPLVTLSDYLRYAALNNAGLKAAFEQWKAATEQVPQAKSLPDPKFTYGYFISEVETRAGPQRHKFEIMQTFPWFGVIEARTDQAAHRHNWHGAPMKKLRWKILSLARLSSFYMSSKTARERLSSIKT